MILKQDYIFIFLFAYLYLSHEPTIFFFQAEDGIRDGHVTEFRRVLFRSLGCVVAAIADLPDGQAGMLVDVRSHPAAIETRACDLLRVLGAEHDDHRDAEVHLVVDRAADVAHRGHQGLEHALARRLDTFGHAVEPAHGDDRDGAGLRRVPSLDVP